MQTSSDEKYSPMQLGKLKIFNSFKSEYATYGFAISQFTGIEQGLLFLFNHLDDRDAQQSITAYWQIGSVRARFDWIDSRMRIRESGDELASSWASIRDRLIDAIETRNHLAHGEFTPISISPDKAIIGYWSRLAKTASTGKLTFNAETQMIDGGIFFSPKQLIAQGLEFINVWEALWGMHTLASASSDRRVREP
ncbi:hypothetical protein [Amaricoccus solimangrovi]|uniref:Uncharacterized protein n=1 Tax=Amaricoccus solimangrovi TaxID=2589815 RepID=A0A501WYH9_9RHOB|nr:hypothetical protein [Amaricoccus solimangrovi]TPE52587.1 hypothetical protein FJM51_05255 [Amaricoccus solimangrovi]